MDDQLQEVRDELLWQYLRRRLPTESRSVLAVGPAVASLAARLIAGGHQVVSATTVGQLPAAPVAPDRGFDVILCHGALETSPDPAASLHALVSRLNEGGGLSLLVANEASAPLRVAVGQGDLQAALDLLTLGTGDATGGRAVGFRVDEITRLCGDAGLALLDVLPVGVVTELLPRALLSGVEVRARLLLLDLELSRQREYRGIGRLIWCWGTRDSPAPGLPA